MAIQFCQAEKNFLTIIKVICDKIMLKNGPYLKEGIYQEILYHEFGLLGMVPKREVVFGPSFIDSEDKQVFIGNGHSLRTDIEITTNNCILELKSSGNDTKEENIWQLRNYLEQRPDMTFGIVINFVSKFGKREDNTPYVQYDLLSKTGEVFYENYQRINKYYHYGPLYSNPYPTKDKIFLRDPEPEPEPESNP